MAPPNYYPELEGLDPQLQVALRMLFDRTYQLQASQQSTRQAVLRQIVSLRQRADGLQTDVQEISELPALEMLQSGDSTPLTAGQASLLPIITGSMGYANTGNSITWSWTGRKIQWPNGYNQPIPDGTKAATGLALSTTYTFYPTFNIDLGVVQFISNASGSGTEQIAFLARNDDAAIAMNSDHMVALASAGIQAATTGGGAGPGGSGGGSGCLHESMVVKTKRGIIPIGDVVRQDKVWGPSGWNTVVGGVSSLTDRWLGFDTHRGDLLKMTPEHALPAYLGEGKSKRKVAGEWSLTDIMFGIADAIEIVEGVRKLPRDLGKAVCITCVPDHAFFFGVTDPLYLSLNVVPDK